MWPEKRSECLTVRIVEALLLTPSGHEPLPRTSLYKLAETVERQMTFEVIERVGNNLKTVRAGAGSTVVERGVERMSAGATGSETAAMCAVEDERDVRKGALAVLSGDKRQIVCTATTVFALTCSCPATIFWGGLKIVHSGGRAESPNRYSTAACG